MFVRLRLGIPSWFQFQPEEDEDDGQAIFRGDSRGKMSCQRPSLMYENFNQYLDEWS